MLVRRASKLKGLTNLHSAVNFRATCFLFEFIYR
ncbi:hypothetical protein swp_2500 [Shewanella piezotolerans WP3]|uniref:Uncharacterized protein n=1 Tax=Shewanella piezotolerans (strain WP3 / JCM 13877) TaxID=225849 RepID=B8CNZ7_SHEPW|nr:hypothetical protein swp_2500 [Shewanella piezotolerans WP3]